MNTTPEKTNKSFKLSEGTVAWALVAVALMTLVGGFILEKTGGSSAFSIGCYVLAYLSGGYFGVLSGFESLRNREVDVDLLMILAALGAAWVGAPFEGGMLLFLFSLSNVLQTFAMERSHNAIHSLMKLRPSEVMCKVGHEWKMVQVEIVELDTVVRVRPGESVALDGVVLKGESSIDESSITGESMPLHKKPGDEIFAGTMNQSGSLEYRVTKKEADSTLSKIVNLVDEAQGKKAKSERFLEKAEQHYALGVILLTLGLIIVPPLVGADFSASFYRAMTVMVVASPCALVISTPAAFLSAIGGAARSGVLFKGGVHLERMAEIKTIAFDKTGTLTVGKPTVNRLMTFEIPDEAGSIQKTEESEAIQIAAALESHSEHPLARAVEQYSKAKGINTVDVHGFKALTGKGAWGEVDGSHYLIGNPSLFSDLLASSDRFAAVRTNVDEMREQGETLIMLGKCDSTGEATNVMAIFSVTDRIRDNAKSSIQKLRALGVKRIVMLTGDHAKVAESISREAGLDDYYASLLPEQKMETIQKLESEGPVLMVGDGVNDAPALASAHVGVAMGAAGTDVAMETADVVLMSSNLEHLVHALEKARKSRRIVLQNLIFALSVIVVLVICTLTIGIPLPLGVVGHEGSTVLVCLNGLRLLAKA